MERRILDAVVKRVAEVGGVTGVVLGGSRARGTHRPDSDFDIGIYYENEETLDVPALTRASADLDDGHRDNLIAPPGGWGPWQNGGAWLTMEGRAVDLILRDIRRVTRAIEDGWAGIVNAHYQPGHPHAYLNVMYMGELAVARIAHDPAGALTALKARTAPYPPKMKATIINLFSFEAGFSCMLAKRYVGKDEAYYVAAHIVRSLGALNQLLFAANEEYCLNEKKAVGMIDGFARKPERYKRRVDEIVAAAGHDAERACALLESLVEDARKCL